MDRPPVPPTALPDAPRSEGADANRRSGSAYRGLDARESSAKYVGQLRSISVQLIVVLLANLVVMLWAVRLERYVLYLVALALTLVAAFVTRLRKVKLFTGLSEVVGEDLRPRPLSRGARGALDRLSAFRKNFKEGARDRAFADEQLLDYGLLLQRPAERDAADAARMRERMMLATCHQQRANWQLYLAEYELLHGSADEAARLASDPVLEPLTPRMERLRAEVLSGLEVSGRWNTPSSGSRCDPWSSSSRLPFASRTSCAKGTSSTPSSGARTR